MKGLDTNILVRYLTEDDPRQAAAAVTITFDKALRGNPRFHVLTVY